MEQLEIQHGVREGSLRQLREQVREAIRFELADEVGNIELAAELVGKVKGTSRWVDPSDPEWSELHDSVATALHTNDASAIPLSWDEAIEAWRKRRERRKGEAPSPKSELAMRNAVAELQKRSLMPTTLTEEEVWVWIRDLESQEPRIAPTTIRSKTSMIKALTKALASQKLIRIDPLASFSYEVAATAGITFRSLNDEEIAKVASQFDQLSPEDSIFTETLLRTGLRLDELASRRWTDIDGNWLFIKPITDEQGKVLWRTKTPESTRKVFINDDLLAKLQQIRKEGSDQLFPSCTQNKEGKFGKNISERIRGFMRKKCDLTGRDVVVHSFRNNYIDACRSVEMEVGVEMALVGHVDSGKKTINKVHRDYGSGYPDDVLLKWAKKADAAMKKSLETRKQLD